MFKLDLERQRKQKLNCQHPRIFKKAREFQKNIYFCFMYYAKAFDCVYHNKLCRILRDRRIVWRFLKKLRTEIPHDPAIVLLGIFPEKTIIQRDTCAPVFTTALFTIARIRPSRDEWIKKMWYMHAMKHYSVIKKKSNTKLGHLKRCEWTKSLSYRVRKVKKRKTNHPLMHTCGI